MDLFQPPDEIEAKERYRIALLNSPFKDKFGNGITFEVAQILFENLNYRRVDFTQMETGEISTVWMPWGAHLGNEYFETLVTFKEYSDVVARYGTITEAIQGHNRWVKRYYTWVASEYLNYKWRDVNERIESFTGDTRKWKKYVLETIRFRQSRIHSGK